MATITFTAGTTTTVTDFTLSGTVGNLVTLNSSGQGTQFLLRKTTGVVDVNYLDIRDSNAASAFFSNITSTNSGNNTGWNFTAPAVVQSNLMQFF